MLNLKFSTTNTSAVPTTLAGTPAISVYKNNSTTQSTSGVTLSVDFDSVTGLNNVAIDTSADGAFYTAANDFQIIITAGTVGGTSVVGAVVGSFSIQNRVVKAVVGDLTGNIDGDVFGNLDGNLNGNLVGSVEGAIADKTGYLLASTGLDAITATLPTGVASTFPQRLMQLWQRFFMKNVLDTSGNTLKVYAADNTTVVTTQAATTVTTTQTVGKAS